MASFITTMSVPATPPAAHFPSPEEPASRSPQSHLPSVVSPPALYQTTRTSHIPFSDPPSYLSPAVRALKQGCFGLTPPSNARTRAPFKPRSAAKGTSSYQLRQFAEATLGSGSLRKAVKLPEGEDQNEWLAVNSKTHLVKLCCMHLLMFWQSSCRLLQPDQPSLRVNN
jgi:MOB kinase activator 1